MLNGALGEKITGPLTSVARCGAVGWLAHAKRGDRRRRGEAGAETGSRMQ